MWALNGTSILCIVFVLQGRLSLDLLYQTFAFKDHLKLLFATFITMSQVGIKGIKIEYFGASADTSLAGL